MSLHNKLRLFLLFFLGLLATAFFISFSVKAQGCPATDWDCQVAELQREYDARKDAHEKNKTDLETYKKQLASFNARLASLDRQFKETEKEIKVREEDLGDQEELLSARLREMYKREREFNILTLLLSSKSVSDFSQGLALRRTAAQQDWQIITSISQKLVTLKNDKESLKKNQASLSSLKAQASKQVEFLEGEVEKTEGFFAKIKAKQKELLAMKEGGFSTSVGDVPLADDPASRPDYNPGFSPAFAAFSFGAPHRKGMSQYGAYGRAKSGQSAEEILRAYYGGVELKKDYSTGINITVQGYGTVDIETYVKRIYEMPTSWGDKGGFEALKAQAVAARSYALAYTNNGAGSICATESCQVYKPANKGGKWDEAVNATRGWVLVAGGKPFSAWYASTAGGYTYSYSHNGHTTPGLWDTSNGRSGWTSQAYEKVAESPWFYKAWYKTRSAQTCGRSHPWLTETEFADIVNAALIYSNGGDVSGIFPTDRCLYDQEGWSKDKMAAEASKHGGPVAKINNVEVFYSNDGYTSKVYIDTDKGRKEFTGEEFKHVFNLRAPGAISLKSALFNIMQK
ncbi:hypothetical protein C4578_00160 [Candidatus Microgenomates bacterium]|jgi:peptidoglycan hydrolase-like amidase/peptidoglycan hydrolase CwlO-like protein|nr:MAG: hypothetical protein C4578_00160 [Candidatus Microgenomates bacterium]